MKRVAYGACLILAAFITPWWCAVLLSIMGILYFENMYEVIFVGLIIDMLYGIHVSWFGITIWYTIGLSAALYILTNIKSRILL